MAGIGSFTQSGQNVFRAYNDEVFDRFWKHDLDIESPAALADVLKHAGADAAGFGAFVEGEGTRELKAVQDAAEAKGGLRRAELPLSRRRPVLGTRASAA